MSFSIIPSVCVHVLLISYKQDVSFPIAEDSAAAAAASHVIRLKINILFAQI
jgi:hypothetical protein